MNLLILAQAAAPAPASTTSSMLGMFLPFALMIFVFYFLIIRPQSKKQKEHQKMLDALEINDRVVTSSGIIGIIVNIKNDKNSIVIRVDDTTGTRIEFQKSAVIGKLSND